MKYLYSATKSSGWLCYWSKLLGIIEDDMLYLGLQVDTLLSKAASPMTMYILGL